MTDVQDIHNSNGKTLYICDPEKNTKCSKTGCKRRKGKYDECDCTKFPEFQKDGTKPFRVVRTHKGYEREYLP